MSKKKAVVFTVLILLAGAASIAFLVGLVNFLSEGDERGGAVMKWLLLSMIPIFIIGTIWNYQTTRKARALPGITKKTTATRIKEITGQDVPERIEPPGVTLTQAVALLAVAGFECDAFNAFMSKWVAEGRIELHNVDYKKKRADIILRGSATPFESGFEQELYQIVEDIAEQSGGRGNKVIVDKAWDLGTAKNAWKVRKIVRAFERNAWAMLDGQGFFARPPGRSLSDFMPAILFIGGGVAAVYFGVFARNILAAVLAAVAGFVGTGIASAWARGEEKRSPMKSPVYANAVAGLQGFAMFLSHFTLMKDRGHLDIPLWESYMHFAALFGVSGNLALALSNALPTFAHLSPTLFYGDSEIQKACSMYSQFVPPDEEG
nr:hypothetical protein [uncultured bacterium]